jgi:hypothetical protein
MVVVMGVTVKVIKPDLPRYKDMVAVLQAHSLEAGKGILKDFQATTATWEHKVTFQLKQLGPMFIEVMTDDEIYGYVNSGTRPHTIRARNAKRLAFASAFSPKTKPRVIGSGAGSKGAVDTFRQEVHHPGTEAREFSTEIYKKWEPYYYRLMEKAMAQAAKVSGHSMK